MSVVPFLTDEEHRSVVTDAAAFSVDGNAVLILHADEPQLRPNAMDCNACYDLRVGGRFRDHRDQEVRQLGEDSSFTINPGMAFIIQTEEEVRFPRRLFGQILPRVSLLQQGLANTPSKVDPGYQGPLLITVFNHGMRPVQLKRRQHFCALFMSRVEPLPRPYNKGGKQIDGRSGSMTWRERALDWLDTHTGPLTAVLIVVSIVALIVALAK